MFDLLISGGTVVDGTGQPRFAADVAVAHGRIAAVGRLGDAPARRTIDARAHVITPGFVDIHTHSDLTLLDDPGGESKACQGVTTEVVGNCGFSPFPAGPPGPAALRATLGSTLPSRTVWDWSDLAGWAARVAAQGVSLNVAPLVGHAALRVAAGATEDRPPTADQARWMDRLLAEALEQGAFGLSTGLTLPPSSYGSTEEVIRLARVLADYPGGLYATHARVWAGWHVKAVEEAVRVGQAARVPVQYSHIAIIDPRAHGRAAEVLGVLDRARADDVDVACDVYPYTAAGSGLSQLVPEWLQEGGVPRMLERLRDPVTRARARADTARGWFGGLPWDWPSIVLASVRSQGNQTLVGRSLAAAAAVRGEEPVETLLALIDEEDNHVTAVMHNRIEADMRTFLAHPLSAIGSDGRAVSPHGLYASARPHPRFYGTYPRVLGPYVRDVGLLSLEAAVHKMTGLPAARLALQDRGRVAPGLAADLVVLDPATVADRATFEDPHRYPVGIVHVLVNGELLVEAGRHTGRRPGQVLRRSPR